MDDTEFHALVTQFREMYQRLRAEMNINWKRDLPLEELLFDRWERAQHLGFGKSASIYHASYLYGDVKVGEGTWIGPMTMLDGTAGITIGQHCSISSGVHIYTHDTVKWALSGGTAPAERSPVIIEDCCYIGSQSVIRRGVTIGHHSVIGAHSFVNKDIPPYSIAAGVPARLIGRVEIAGDEIRLVYDQG